MGEMSKMIDKLGEIVSDMCEMEKIGRWVGTVGDKVDWMGNIADKVSGLGIESNAFLMIYCNLKCKVD